MRWAGRRWVAVGAAVVVGVATAGTLAWWRSDRSGGAPVRLTQVWSDAGNLGDGNGVMAVWAMPGWFVRVSTNGPTAYDWSDGKSPWSLAGDYYSMASPTLSADGTGIIAHQDPSGTGNNYYSVDVLHGTFGPRIPDGAERLRRARHTLRPQTPGREAGTRRDWAEIDAQDPATGRYVGRYEVPAGGVVGHAQYIVQGPGGVVVVVPLKDDDGGPVAFRRS